MKKILIVFLLIFLLSTSYATAKNNVSHNVIKFAYIPDLNLYPTPGASFKEKNLVEMKRGILLYENQSVFQDIIRQINLQIKPDIVIFGGNNIFKPRDAKSFLAGSDYLQLFLDMASEIKSEILLIFGINEIMSREKEDLLNILNSFGVKANDYWWSYKFKNYNFIGLDSELFFLKSHLANKQLEWFSKNLSGNQDSKTIVLLHKPLIYPDGRMIPGESIKRFFDIVAKNPQVILLLSGGSYLNRVKLLQNVVYVLSPSPVVFPCGFKEIEINKGIIRIKTVNIPLKGVIKKAESSLKDSEFARSMYPDSPKKVLEYVTGTGFDINASIKISDLKPDLRNR